MLRNLNGRLIALRAPSSLDPKTDLPARLVMLKWGENPTTKGKFIVGQKSLQSLAANQRALGFDEIVLDFEHNTVPGHPNNKGEPAAIAARCVPKVIENEGLVFETLNWTEAGKHYREHYRDLSPAIQTDESGEVIFCHSGAICRNGATFDLHAFSAGYDFKTLNMTMFDQAAAARNEAVNKVAVDLDRLRKLLSLSADATVEDINRALVSLEAMPADATGLSADVAAQIRALAAKVSGFELRFVDTERAGIVTEALNAGKIIPQEFLEGEHKLGNGQLKVLVAGLPSIVPLDQRTPERLKDFVTLTPVNPIAADLDRQLGITPEMNSKWYQKD
jgi:phage I-like protein